MIFTLDNYQRYSKRDRNYNQIKPNIGLKLKRINKKGRLIRKTRRKKDKLNQFMVNDNDIQIS